MDAVVNAYPAAVLVAGGSALAGALLVQPPRPGTWPAVIVMAGIVTVLRRFPVALSKYSYHSFVNFVGLAGSLLLGPVVAMLALAIGIVL
ncbi:MAG TPA: hypothetical protein VKR80_07960, partial [Candidatus Limnocylindria bacterium]|nr:hypothetical protein [Candidatus Limnocylindria bacterium]